MSNLTRSASLNDINSQEEDSIVDPTTMTDGIDSSGSQSGQYMCTIHTDIHTCVMCVFNINVLLVLCGCCGY